MSVRVLCTGDFQLDKAFGTLGPEAETFREQLMKTFAKVVQTHGPHHDLILIAGDMFDRKATPTSIIEEAATVLASCNTPCLIIPGNHDPVNSGIPSVLQEVLSQRGATHVHVAVERKPIEYKELGLTVFPAPLFRKDDLSDQWGWIPERTKEQGTRIALMHGALDSLPGGLIPEDLAIQKDLDLVVCGDQHGPGNGVSESSNLFNLDISKRRKLYYAMAPEAQHINQNFTGAFLTLELKENGEIKSSERMEVGEIRFVNETISFDHNSEDESHAFDTLLASIDGRPTQLTSIRLTIQGELQSESYQQLNVRLSQLKTEWPLLELINEVTTRNTDDWDQQEVDPLVGKIEQALSHDTNLDPLMKARILELLRINLGRWQ
jgi:hypothetical protein